MLIKQTDTIATWSGEFKRVADLSPGDTIIGYDPDKDEFHGTDITSLSKEQHKTYLVTNNNERNFHITGEAEFYPALKNLPLPKDDEQLCQLRTFKHWRKPGLNKIKTVRWLYLPRQKTPNMTHTHNIITSVFARKDDSPKYSVKSAKRLGEYLNIPLIFGEWSQDALVSLMEFILYKNNTLYSMGYNSIRYFSWLSARTAIYVTAAYNPGRSTCRSPQVGQPMHNYVYLEGDPQEEFTTDLHTNYLRRIRHISNDDTYVRIHTAADYILESRYILRNYDN